MLKLRKWFGHSTPTMLKPENQISGVLHGLPIILTLLIFSTCCMVKMFLKLLKRLPIPILLVVYTISRILKRCGEVRERNEYVLLANGNPIGYRFNNGALLF